MLGGGEKLLIELVDFCLKNNIQPEVLITDNLKRGDNDKQEYYDSFLKSKDVVVHRVPIFLKPHSYRILKYYYWRFKLRNSDKYYDAVHVINLNLSERVYGLVKNKKRVFWHIINKMQYPGGYPYAQKLVGNPTDSIVTINKFQLPELHEYFKNIVCKIVDFKLFLNEPPTQ